MISQMMTSYASSTTRRETELGLVVELGKAIQRAELPPNI
jgi:hypothetical protein